MVKSPVRESYLFCPSSLVISPANIMGFPASSQITLPLHSTHTYSPIRFLALYWHSCRGFVPENTPEISSLYNALSSGWICCSQIVAASSRYSPDKPKYSTEALDHREIFVFISHTYNEDIIRCRSESFKQFVVENIAHFITIPFCLYLLLPIWIIVTHNHGDFYRIFVRELLKKIFITLFQFIKFLFCAAIFT